MAKFEPKYFSTTLEGFAKEVLTPSIYKKYGSKGLRKMDQRILEFLDEFRHDTGVPLTVNTPWNGSFTQSGLRDVGHYGSYEKLFLNLSDHPMGRAIDAKCKHGGKWLRKKFIEREEYYYEKYGVNFVEVGPISDTNAMDGWAHFSIRLDLDGKPLYWSPVLGFVTKERVLEENL